MNRTLAKINSILMTEDEDYNEDSHQVLTSWCEEVIEEFLSSPYCSSWKSNKKNIAGFFIHGFINYAYGYHLAKPFQYDEKLVEDMCLDILPRKMSTSIKDFKLVAPALIAFFEWCESKGILENTRVLCDKLKEIDSEIYKVAKNPENWGLAKSFLLNFF